MAGAGEDEWQKTNVGGIGSDEDKALRKAVAEEDPAWEGAGTTPGVTVWRIEHFEVVRVDRANHGKFHKGDSYIVLDCVESAGGHFINTIYFLLGPETSVDEQGTAAYKAVELDDLLDGLPTQHRERMMHESDGFKALFERIEYLEGGIDSGFKHVVPAGHDPKLYVCRRTKGENTVTRAPLKKCLINKHDCFVLDAAEHVYVLDGENASPFLKRAACDKANAIESERADGKTKCWSGDAGFDDFWKLLA
uniref:Gelsolin-like domain-containing protein n=1 Tax=Zooxanthella nutricula TaxID=1333877 RepID=A0A6U8X864_9DINO